MEKKLRYVHVMACSNFGTRLQLTLSAETDDLRDLISQALVKIAHYSSSSEEKFFIEYIDSISHLHDVDK
jgi:hypothetical protein